MADHRCRNPRRRLVAQTWGNAIRVEGLKELKRALREAPPEVKREFNKSMRGIVSEMVDAVRSQMPEVTGDAQSSVRVSTAGNYLAIRAGGERAPYYPWLDFGGTLKAAGGRHNEQHRPFFHEGRWIYPTVARHRPEIYRKAMEAVERAKGRVGL